MLEQQRTFTINQAADKLGVSPSWPRFGERRRRILNRWGKEFPEEHKATAPTFINEDYLYDDIPF